MRGPVPRKGGAEPGCAASQEDGLAAEGGRGVWRVDVDRRGLVEEGGDVILIGGREGRHDSGPYCTVW